MAEENNDDLGLSEVKIKKPEITEVHKERFFKAFLADKPFIDTESLFGGQFVVEFKALTVEESSDVFEQLRRDQVGQAVTTDAAYMMTLTNYRLALAISKLNDEPFQPEITKGSYKPVDSYDSYVKARAELLRKWPVFKLSAVAEAFKSFEDRMIELTKAIEDPDFWKAAE